MVRRSKWRRQIDHRFERIPRYRSALLHTMATFGDGFDLEALEAAYAAEDPETISRVTALEGEFAHLVNWLVQIAELGYHELLRLDKAEKASGSPLDRLVALGILSERRKDRLLTLAVVRNRLQHTYPDVSAEEVHQAVLALLDELPALVRDYRRWLEALDG